MTYHGSKATKGKKPGPTSERRRRSMTQSTPRSTSHEAGWNEVHRRPDLVTSKGDPNVGAYSVTITQTPPGCNRISADR